MIRVDILLHVDLSRIEQMYHTGGVSSHLHQRSLVIGLHCLYDHLDYALLDVHHCDEHLACCELASKSLLS